MKYRYYDFLDDIAREVDKPDACWEYPRGRFEFYKDGKWIQDQEKSLALSDAMMDYGDYSIYDYDDITEEEAMKRIAELDKENEE